MENKPKRSKALIITIILVLILLLVGFLLFKNAKNSSSTNFFSRIFSSLAPSSNTKTETVQAGEDISKGDSVTQAGTASNGSPVVVKSRNGSTILGIATEDIGNGGFGEITISGSGFNNFFNSFSGFIGDLFGGDGTNTITVPPGGEITITPDSYECSDTIDNDGDEKIDDNDPECHVDGDLEKEYLPEHDSESNIGGDITPNSHECSDTIDNDGDEKIDAEDPGCHIDGDLEKEYLPNKSSESDTTNQGELTPVDLTAGIVSPTNTTTNTLTTLSATISNTGGMATEKSFYGFFTITNVTSDDIQIDTKNTNVASSKIKTFISKIVAKIPWISTKKTIAEKTVEVNTLMSPLAGKSNTVANIFYTFDQAGAYYIRACADKSSASDTGVVDESNEENNCGAWITFTVSDTLPTGGDIITGDDEITTDDEYDDTTVYGEENKCLLIEQNPLTFTDDEKARLEELLRKFYLTASTLRTTDDIATIYDEIDQYQNLINQTDNLSKQCYLETNDTEGYKDFCKRNSKLCSSGDRFNTLYDNMARTKHGNPWYTKTKGGTFPYDGTVTGYDDNGNKTYSGYTNYLWLDGNYTYDSNGNRISLYLNGIGPGCKITTGYYYGTATINDKGDTVDCDQWNNSSYIRNWNDCWQGLDIYNKKDAPDQSILDRGCKWKGGVSLEGTERILNIW